MNTVESKDKGKGKVEFTIQSAIKAQRGEYMYSYTLSWPRR